MSLLLTCLTDAAAAGYKFLCEAVKESRYWRLFYLCYNQLTDLTVVILDTFSIKLLTESLKAWEGVVNSLFYLFLRISTFWQQGLLYNLVKFSMDQAKDSFQEKEESIGPGLRVSLLGFLVSSVVTERDWTTSFFLFLTVSFLLLSQSYCAIACDECSHHTRDYQWEEGMQGRGAILSLKSTLRHKFLIWPQRSHPHSYPSVRCLSYMISEVSFNW